MPIPNPTLSSIVLLLTVIFLLPAPALSQPPKLKDRAFFTRDIFLFSGHLFPSPPLNSILPVRQRFRSTCANLNRVILAFAFEGKSSGWLAFQFFQGKNPQQPIYKEIIDAEKFHSSQKMGSHNLKGIFHTIWLPIQENSENSEYIWTLSPQSGSISRELSLYLTNRESPQVPTLSGSNLPSARAAFFTYCQYRFDWGEIVGKIGHRFEREAGFLIAFMFLIVGNGYWIFRAGSRFRNSK